jgi:hypothetical protein
MQVVREQPGAALAPHALYAAGLLTPDSAAAWGQRIAREYSGSAVARWIAGDDPASQSDFASVPALLSQRWGVAIRVWADSVRKMRTPAGRRSRRRVALTMMCPHRHRSFTLPRSARAPMTSGRTHTGNPLAMQVAGLVFRNPIVLAAGTAGFGEEIDDVIDLAAIGGLATKAVSVLPRHGAPPLRVSEFAGGMINAIGLANPGLDEVKRHAMPWLARRDAGLRVLVNVVGNSVEEFDRRLDAGG